MDKRKLLGTIIGVFAFIALVLGATYAYFAWTSGDKKTNINLTITKGLESMIVYEQGTSILETSGEQLEASSNYSGGINTTIEFWKRPQASKIIYGQLSLKILNLLSVLDTNDTNIAKTETIKWAITTYNVNDSNEVLLKEGTFKGKKIDDKWEITEVFELNDYQTFFKVYLWLDSSALEKKYPVSGELLSTEISASASDINTIYTNAVEFLVNTQLKNQGSSGWDSNVSNPGLYALNYTTDDGTLLDTEYRYVGANPNNYVWFNNDLYRIIGIFNENSHGVVDENGNGVQLVKLIAANQLTANAWGIYSNNNQTGTYTERTNDWSGTTTGYKSSLNILLSEYFLENPDTVYGTCGKWTHFASDATSRTYNCSDIYGYSLKANNGIQDYIEEVTWYLKGFGHTEDVSEAGDHLKQDIYLCERGFSTDSDCMSGGVNGEYSPISTGKIGLMYASDYLYASGYVSSTDTNILASDSLYGNKNWLYKGFDWTMTPVGGSAARVTYANHRGVISSYDSHIALGIRPSFYLKNSVSISGGDGSFDNPYTISN